MDMLGIENYTISGKAGNEQHIWNVVKLDNDWYQVDVTWDDPVGSSQEYIDHSYFNISDSDMAIDHTWTSDSNETNPANGYIYTYPVQAKLHSAGTQYELDRYILRCIKSRSQHIEFTTTNELDIKSAVYNVFCYIFVLTDIITCANSPAVSHTTGPLFIILYYSFFPVHLLYKNHPLS